MVGLPPTVAAAADLTLTADRLAVAPGDQIHVLGSGCVSTTAEEPAEVFLTAARADGAPWTTDPVLAVPYLQPDGSWSAWVQAPGDVGQVIVRASCSTYTATVDYPELVVDVRTYSGPPAVLVSFSEGTNCLASVQVRTEVQGDWTVGPTLPQSEYDGSVETDPARTGWDLVPAGPHNYTFSWVLNAQAVALSPSGFVFGTAPNDQFQVLPPTSTLFAIPWSALSAATRQACLGSADPVPDPSMEVDRTVLTPGQTVTVSGTGCPPPFLGTEAIRPVASFPPLGVSVMVSGHIDPSHVTPAADGSWTWATSALPAGGSAAVTATCVTQSGSFEYAPITLTVKGASSGAGAGGTGKYLSKTGLDVVPETLMALGLLLAGAGLIFVARRRLS